MKINQAIVIGSGDSINVESSYNEINSLIKDRLSFCINANYRNIHDMTALIWGDQKFYYYEHDNVPNLPLCIARNHDTFHCDWFFKKERRVIPHYTENHLTLESGGTYTSDWSKGVYKGYVMGLFALSVAIKCLQGVGEVYLLGFDACRHPETGRTHCFTQDDLNYQYKGLKQTPKWMSPDRINNDKLRQDKLFEPFLTEPSIKIYNVSQVSKINQFEKITYKQFKERLTTINTNQSQIRKEIVSILRPFNRNPHFNSELYIK